MLQTAERISDRSAVLWAGFFSLLVLTAGLVTAPCLGDEISFYRLAQGFFQDHARWAIDPIYLRSGLIYYYNSETLWPALLGAIWTLMGCETAAVAQIYHAFYFFLLLFFTYKLAKIWFSEKQALTAIVILTAMPMTAAFGILFYTEIPMTALVVTASWLLVQRKTAAAGILMGLACLTKLTAVFFLPAMTLFIFGQKKEKVIWFIAPVFFALFADFAWRKTHLNVAHLFSYEPQTVTSPSAWQTLLDRFILKDALQRFKELKQSGIWEFTNSSFMNLVDLVKYFGPVFLILFTLSFWKKRPVEEKSREALLVCWGMAGSYFVCCLYVFIFSPDVRSLLPLTPFLAILASRAVTSLVGKKMAVVIASFCLLQFSASVLHVVKERRVPDGIREGFEFIRQNVPEDGLVLYPEYILLKETDRGMVWSHRFRDQMAALFWDKDKAQILDYFYKHKIRTVAVKKDRVYDDTKQKHFGGYPRSFVESMPVESRFKLLYENQSISVWSIQ